ncbi:MAG: aldehyde dehydrogenase [Deltaproteobacteria bacterium]|nr:aldehyde dehydrogenase [Deltaproteobacteria bacterium]MBU49095.1 aldehyde dehydrogenase [Deltaproteobacteria bacterium]|tara:strand:+ start:1699 stop:3081 length:1383 start_codon:yes stop_codon:yes gene_type:complete
MSTQFQVRNPYNDEEVGSYTYASAEEVADALDKLKRGKKVLRGIPAFQRAEILHKLGELLETHQDELAKLIVSEIGKTLKESRTEVARAAVTARASGDEAKRMSGEVLDSDAYPPSRGRLGIVRRQPLGVVLAITPFNFPINLAMHKIGPAFASGNTVFFKPGPQNYFSGKRLVELCYEAGMPEETLQLCVPDIPELTKVIEGDDVQVISFTGGVPTANAIARNARGKKLLFELGGNDPLIVMDDADLDKAVETAIAQRFGTAGQRCTAAKRLMVHKDVFEAFRDKLVEATNKLVVGDPMSEDSYIGPVVSSHAADVVMARIEQAVADGAKLLAGGKREGNVIWPTILEGITMQCELCADETFGPVIPLLQFSTIDEVIELVNMSEFGLQSGVFTNQMDVVMRLYEELEVGSIAVNDGPGFRAEHFPFGGVKNSGLGREGIKYAIEEMTYYKSLVLPRFM